MQTHFIFFVSLACSSFLSFQVPERAEIFYISLATVYGGGRLSTDGGTIATVTVQSSDDPHGAFAFVPGSRSLTVDETGGTMVTMFVERLFGTLGTVVLNYTTATDFSVPTTRFVSRFFAHCTHINYKYSAIPAQL